jgi:hypothetical protein
MIVAVAFNRSDDRATAHRVEQRLAILPTNNCGPQS